MNIKNINLSALSVGLDNFFKRDAFSTPNDLISYYNEGLHSVLDTLVPFRLSVWLILHLGLHLNWDNLKLRDVAWNVYALCIKTLKLTVHKDMYTDHMLYYKNALLTAKSDTLPSHL